MDNREIDNYQEVKKYLNFDNEDHFYYLQIISRKKENPEQDKSVKVIKDYYINTMRYYDLIEEQVKMLCRNFNARSYLRLNRRSWKKVGFNMMRKLASILESGDHQAVKTLLSKSCGTTSDEVSESKVWIVDIDDVDPKNNILHRNYVDNIKQVIEELQSEVKDKEYNILGELETKSGIHILTNPFNVYRFNEHFEGVDIHKDNMVNLYIPNKFI